MAYIVDNAIILAAGLSSRFAPLSFEKPKALIEVKEEVLIERQIKQLHDAGVNKVYVVVGYKKEEFYYLEEKFDVVIIHNDEFNKRNNNSSIYAARHVIKNSYICSADNYFIENPFESIVDESYYSSVFIEGRTNEWCMEFDSNDYIRNVNIGGENSWVMLGHTFWSSEFSDKFINILMEEYDKPETADKYWEDIFVENIDELQMKIRKYKDDIIFEFDSLNELREFDKSYVKNTRSKILREIANAANTGEEDISNIKVLKNKEDEIIGFSYCLFDKEHMYYFEGNNNEKNFTK